MGGSGSEGGRKWEEVGVRVGGNGSEGGRESGREG